MPDMKARAKVLEIFLSKMACSGVSPKWLAERTEGFSGADLEMVCQEAGMLALRESIRPDMRREELIVDRITVSKEHFDEALKIVRPHLSREMLEEYQKMICEFKA
jgi:transitional endoplasmic reticulum ATPase